jgi:hypothetical protein
LTDAERGWRCWSDFARPKMNRSKLRDLRKRIDAGLGTTKPGPIVQSADWDSLRQELWNIANAAGDEPQDYDLEVVATTLALVLDKLEGFGTSRP